MPEQTPAGFLSLPWWADLALGAVVTWLLVRAWSTVIAYITARRITREILKNNRPCRDQTRGYFIADRFIEVWYSDGKTYTNGNTFYTMGIGQSAYYVSAIDRMLSERGLVVLEGNDDSMTVKPVRRLRNRMVCRLVERHLVRCGDPKEYYLVLRSKQGK